MNIIIHEANGLQIGQCREDGYINLTKMAQASDKDLYNYSWSDFPCGQVIAVCDLVDCIEMTQSFTLQQSATEILRGDWQVGRYAWKLENIQSVKNRIAVKGKQGLFSIAVTNLQLLVNEEHQKPTALDPQLLTPDSQPPKSHKPIRVAAHPEESNRKGKSKPSDRCYTPPHIVELIVRVLGAIDLDPCADEKKHIPARLHYTEADDGLSKPWFGRVFFNPPYSCPGKWVAWFLQEYAGCRAIEAIALLLATDTNWLFPVLKAQPVCFWKGRIKFLDENYQPMRSGARQSHVLLYWGDHPQLFKEVFDEYGMVYLPSSVLTVNQSNSTVTTQENSKPESVLTVEELTVSTTAEYQVGGDTVLTVGLTVSTKRRSRGKGTGKIQWRTITKKNGKQYPQAWYDWQLHSGGETIYRSTYIPKKLVSQVQDLEANKTPVWEILGVLGVELKY